ncbi:hypothetical protein Tco_0323290 [Tanacetum coccineum]
MDKTEDKDKIDGDLDYLIKEFNLLKWDPTRGILHPGTNIVGYQSLLLEINFARDMDQDFCIHENGNTAPKTTVVEGVEKIIPPTTAKEKAQKRLEVKARRSTIWRF